MQFILHNEKETEALGAKLALIVPEKALIFLEGNLGMGKTTFVRGFIKSLGYTGAVKSPTYNIVEEYKIENNLIFHFDLYRLNDPEELEWIGIDDYLHENAISFIEWPEQGVGYLGIPSIIISFESYSIGRKIDIQGIPEEHEKLLEC